MSDPLLLNALYKPRHHTPSKVYSNDRAFRSFFEGHQINLDLNNILLPACIQKNFNPWLLIENWQELLALLLVLQECGELQKNTPQLIERVRCLSACFVWNELQLACMYQALCMHLLDLPVEKPVIHQYAEGAAPLEWGNRWSWGNIPHNKFHAQLGFLWCLYGHLTEDPLYIKAAESLAEWQFNIIDHRYIPLIGLFTQEEDAAEQQLLVDNFLLNHAVSIFADRAEMSEVAAKQYVHISSQPNIEFSSLQLAYDRWLSKYCCKEPSGQPSLPTFFKDDHTLLAGYRSASTNVVSTLAGGGSSIGCFHREDVHIVSFGPQHLPLGDCRGFGIENNLDSLSSTQINISESKRAYHIQGTVRMSPRPKTSNTGASFRNGEHSGMWIEIEQNFYNEQLIIETTFYGLYDIGNLAFVFFAKAGSCIVDGKNVNLRSFDRYQGPIKNIIFQGKEAAITIESKLNQGEMQVIPLGGGNSFWGADFLVAYLLDSRVPGYSWTIK